MLDQYGSVFAGSHVPIAANSNDAPITIHPLKPSNQVGDILVGAIVLVTDPAACAVTLKDGEGGDAVPLVPLNTPIGVHSIDLFGMRSVGNGNPDTVQNPGGWFVNTGTGVSAIFVGRIK